MSSRGDKKRKQEGKQPYKTEQRETRIAYEAVKQLRATQQKARQQKIKVCEYLASAIIGMDPTKEKLVLLASANFKANRDLEQYHSRLVRIRESLVKQEPDLITNRE